MKHIEKIVIGMIAVLSVLIVIIATDFWLLWLPLAHSSEYPQKVAALFMALTALVTLLVVYATFNATKQSNLREQGRRKDEIEKENRDRKENLLNEIIEWAAEVSICGSVSPFSKYAEIENIQIQKITIANDSITILTSLERRGEYIKRIALKLEYGLGNWVERVMDFIKERNKLLAMSMGIRSIPPLDELLMIINILESNAEVSDDLSDDAKKLLVLGRNARILVESASKVIEEATKIKTSGIG